MNIQIDSVVNKKNSVPPTLDEIELYYFLKQEQEEKEKRKKEIKNMFK